MKSMEIHRENHSLQKILQASFHHLSHRNFDSNDIRIELDEHGLTMFDLEMRNNSETGG